MKHGNDFLKTGFEERDLLGILKPEPVQHTGPGHGGVDDNLDERIEEFLWPNQIQFTSNGTKIKVVPGNVIGKFSADRDFEQIIPLVDGVPNTDPFWDGDTAPELSVPSGLSFIFWKATGSSVGGEFTIEQVELVALDQGEVDDILDGDTEKHFPIGEANRQAGNSFAVNYWKSDVNFATGGGAFIPSLVLLKGTGPTDVFVNPGSVAAVKADEGYLGVPTVEGTAQTIDEPVDINIPAGENAVYFEVATDHGEDPDEQLILSVDVQVNEVLPANTDNLTHIQIGFVRVADGVITQLSPFLSSSILVKKCATPTVVFGGIG